MNRLPGRVQVRIVVQLAAFASPSEVVRSVKEEFDLDVSRQQVERYNPERVAGERLRPSLRRVFYALRADAATNLDAIPLAHRPYRLKRLGEMAKRSEDQGNSVLAAKLLEIAAKDVGGVYEDQRGADLRTPRRS